MERDVPLMRLAAIYVRFRRSWKWTAGIPLSAMVLAASMSFLIPDTYEATVAFLPPKQSQDISSALLGQLGGLGGLAAGAAGFKVKDPTDMYVGFLASRNIRDTLVNRFGLRTRYDAKNVEDAANVLKGRTRIQAGVDGMIRVQVKDRDPKIAAAIANAYVACLNRLQARLGREESSARRSFYEAQLSEVERALGLAESELKAFLKKNRLVSFDATAQVNVQQTAMIQAEIATRQIQLQSASSTLSHDNPAIRQLEVEIGALRSQLNATQTGGGTGLGGTQLVDAGSRYFQLFREVKYREILAEILVKQFELAKLDEAKDGGVAQIVDMAEPPSRKAGPKRMFIVLGIGFLSFAAVVVWHLARELDVRRRWYEAVEQQKIV